MNPTKVTDEKIWEELHQIRNSLHALWNLIRGESPERINTISSVFQFPQQAPISGDKQQADVSLLDILLSLAENACNTSAICQKIFGCPGLIYGPGLTKTFSGCPAGHIFCRERSSRCSAVVSVPQMDTPLPWGVLWKQTPPFD